MLLALYIHAQHASGLATLLFFFLEREGGGQRWGNIFPMDCLRPQHVQSLGVLSNKPVLRQVASDDVGNMGSLHVNTRLENTKLLRVAPLNSLHELLVGNNGVPSLQSIHT